MISHTCTHTYIDVCISHVYIHIPIYLTEPVSKIIVPDKAVSNTWMGLPILLNYSEDELYKNSTNEFLLESLLH